MALVSFGTLQAALHGFLHSKLRQVFLFLFSAASLTEDAEAIATVQRSIALTILALYCNERYVITAEWLLLRTLCICQVFLPNRRQLFAHKTETGAASGVAK